jgi:hypothetical protein
MKTKYVSKKRLYPKFGWADMKNQIAYVREDLPKSVKLFVLEHEQYHLTDKAKWWVWQEIRANFYAAKKQPIGFLYCCLLSLSWGRLKFYIKRFNLGKNKKTDRE